MSFLKQFKNPKKFISFEEYASYIYKNYDKNLDKLGEYDRYKKFYHQLCQGKNPVNLLAALLGGSWFTYRRMFSVVTMTVITVGLFFKPSSFIFYLVDGLITGFFGVRWHWNWLHYRIHHKIPISKGPCPLWLSLLFVLSLAVLLSLLLQVLAYFILIIHMFIKGPV